MQIKVGQIHEFNAMKSTFEKAGRFGNFESDATKYMFFIDKIDTHVKGDTNNRNGKVYKAVQRELCRSERKGEKQVLKGRP